MNYKALSLLGFLSIGCVTSEADVAGMETAACVEGSCFGDLECLSDVCVGPEDSDDDGGTGGESESSSAGPATASTTGPTSATATSPTTESASSETSPSTTGPTSASESDSNSNSDSDSDSETDSASDSETDSASDTEDTDDTVAPGECGEVDVLFVVDNSGSMMEEQGRLQSAASDFLLDLIDTTGSSDPHVMVVDVERASHPCVTECALFQACSSDPEYDCENPPVPSTCDDFLGSGLVRPLGQPTGGPCGLTSGGRYIDGSQPDLIEAFECVLGPANGSGSGDEVPMQAMVEAIDTMGDLEDCNDGFLRDNASLVVVFLTDEEDGSDNSPGSPAGWHIRMVGAKGGDEDEIFVLGLFGDDLTPTANCEAAAEPGPRLLDFIDLWGSRGITGSVCDLDYSDAFDDLLSSVAQHCG